MIQTQTPAKGHCLCGAIRYSVDGPLRAVTTCHCNECRRSTGSVWQATAAYRDTLKIMDPDGLLTWFRSSKHARRGFCRRCGSSLFFDLDDADRIAIAMGSLNPPTGLSLARHIFIEEKGDYYDIADGVAKCEGMAIDLPMPKRN